MKILFASSEVVPFAKTGGLADVAGALPKELTKLGHDIRVIMPRYRQVDKEKFGLQMHTTGIEVKIDGKIIGCAAFESVLPGSKTKAYFIENNDLFDRDNLYQEDGKDYQDNDVRFIFFCRAILKFCKINNFRPEVIHCNDWQTSLIPVLLKAEPDAFFDGIKTILTIHNLVYQGVYKKDVMDKIGIDKEFFRPDRLEYWGKVNFLKGGIIFADKLNTVSEKYAQEIQTEEMGAGLNGVLFDRHHDLSGIINGVDYNVFSPNKDPLIHKPFTLRTVDKKLENKKFLLKQVGLRFRKTTPLYGMISRLADQKGFDILAEIIDQFLEKTVQLVILGTGDPKYHELLSEMEAKHSKKMKVFLKYDGALAQHIYAGSDVFIMPSHYEPCGLGQLISLKYGTIPVVRETGGLADTITDFDLAKDFEHDRGNGFVFYDYNSKALLQTLNRSLETFKDEKAWKKLVANAMRCDFSWKNSAHKYVDLYQKA